MRLAVVVFLTRQHALIVTPYGGESEGSCNCAVTLKLRGTSGAGFMWVRRQPFHQYCQTSAESIKRSVEPPLVAGAFRTLGLMSRVPPVLRRRRLSSPSPSALLPCA